MKKLILILMIFVSSGAIALASKGVVVLNKSGCDYFIVETTKGYALLEWFKGSDPDVGDTIVGAFEKYGMKNVHIINKDRETTVWVEDYWLSKDDVLEKYYEKCN